MTDQAGKPKSKAFRIIAIVIVVLLGTCAYKMNERQKDVAYLKVQLKRGRIASELHSELVRISQWVELNPRLTTDELNDLQEYVKPIKELQKLDGEIDVLRDAIDEVESGLKNKDALRSDLLVQEAQFDRLWRDIKYMREKQGKELSEYIRPAGEKYTDIYTDLDED